MNDVGLLCDWEIRHMGKFAFAIGAFAFAAMLGVDSAHAVGCDISNLTTSTQVECDPPQKNGGNVTLTQMNEGDGVFDIDSWLEIAKIESFGGAEVASDNGGLFWFDGSNGGTAGGAWGLKTGYYFDPNETYAFVLKGSTNAAVYMMATNITGGTWNNHGLFTSSGNDKAAADKKKAGKDKKKSNDKTKKPNNAGLSNVTLFGTASLTTTPPVGSVPLPASAWMLIAAVAGVVFLKRRRSLA